MGQERENSHSIAKVLGRSWKSTRSDEKSLAYNSICLRQCDVGIRNRVTWIRAVEFRIIDNKTARNNFQNREYYKKFKYSITIIIKDVRYDVLFVMTQN